MSWKKYNEQDCTHLLYEGCVDPADEPLDSDEVEENTHKERVNFRFFCNPMSYFT